MKDEYTEITAENADQFKGMEVEFSDFGFFHKIVIDKFNRHKGYDKAFPLETYGGDVYRHARIKNVKEVEKVCELCDTPITEDTNDCCMGRELEELERQLAEAREVIKRVEDLATGYYCQKSEYEESVEIPYWDIIFALNIKEKV